MKSNTKEEKTKYVDLEIGSPEEIADFQNYEKLFIESKAVYSLPEIASKLEKGGSLDEAERQMAAGVIRDWIRLKKSKTGRPRKWSSIKEKNAYYNAKRRGKLKQSE